VRESDQKHCQVLGSTYSGSGLSNLFWVFRLALLPHHDVPAVVNPEQKPQGAMGLATFHPIVGSRSDRGFPMPVRPETS
jgi:hypothetical protein